MNHRLWKVFKKGYKSNNGNIKWKIGEWQHHDGELEMCESGFHASEKIIDAMQYTDAEIIARVEVKGKSIKQEDKQVWSDMRIIKSYKWTKKQSVMLAIYCAELCIGNYEKEYPDDDRPREAIKAAKKWLKNPTEENRSAAWSAVKYARSAQSALSAGSAWSAVAESAWSAVAQSALSAAESARSAAWSAAAESYWSAQSAVAESTRSAAWFKIEKYIHTILED